MNESKRPDPSFADRNPSLGELSVCSVELGFVTAVDEEDDKFFLQLTRFTNKELTDHNKKIHDYCKASEEKKVSRDSIKPKPGQVLCAPYAYDGNWYRTVVKSCNDETQEAQAYFADYGNVITVPYGEFLQVPPSEIPNIAHHPFGFYCKVIKSEDVPDEKKLLNAISNHYILIKPKGRLDYNLWRVEIPSLAFNQALINTLRMDDHAAQSPNDQTVPPSLEHLIKSQE